MKLSLTLTHVSMISLVVRHRLEYFELIGADEYVERGDKLALLADCLKNRDITRALVFTRTKHGADRIVRQLSNSGVPASAIHSNKDQSTRQRTLAAFDRGQVRVLVATDIVARGIDVDQISHVVNFELPNDPASITRLPMPGFAHLDATQLVAIADYVRGLNQP